MSYGEGKAPRRWLRPALKWLGAIVALLLFAFGVAAGALLWGRSEVRRAYATVARIAEPNGIQTGEYIELGGVRQWVSIRGRDRRNPVLVFLHGGPGGTTSGTAYTYQHTWEEFFTVVQWDQRGYGRSALDESGLRGTVNKQQLVSDAIELIETIRTRLRQRKVFLVGHSWGTLLGATVAARRPDLLYAYVGIAQMTSLSHQPAQSRRQLIELAAANGDAEMAAALRKAPLSASAGFDPGIVALLAANGYGWYNIRRMSDLAVIGWTTMLLSPDLSLDDIRRTVFSRPPPQRTAGLLASVAGWDFRKDLGVAFSTPMIFVSGTYDGILLPGYVEQLEREIQAPSKALILLEHTSHSVPDEAPGRLLDILVHRVLPFAQNDDPS